jgi:hypothetical protein
MTQFRVLRGWMSRFPQHLDKSSEISMENPLVLKNLNVDEEASSSKTAILLEKVVRLPTKLKNWMGWKLTQLASLPAQIAWSFSKPPFIEKALLYPRYEKYLREHQSNLPVLDSMDSRIVDELQQTGIFVTSLESLDLPNTSEFFEAGKKLAQDLTEISLHPDKKGHYEILATSDQLVRYKELFQWGLNERLLKIAERYLGLPVAYDGLLSVLSIADGKEIGARAWHRDREDRRMMKVCVYLNNVNDDGGPFQFLHSEINSLLCNLVKGSYRSVFNEELKTFSSATSDKVTTCTGLAGTVIFVDPAMHYHRGKPPTRLNRSAIFFSYFSRRPWHPFFCQRSPLSRKQRAFLSQGMSSYQQACVHWTDNLSWLVKLIPKSRV